jgi:DNA-binding NtrC family response regulator
MKTHIQDSSDPGAAILAGNDDDWISIARTAVKRLGMVPLICRDGEQVLTALGKRKARIVLTEPALHRVTLTEILDVCSMLTPPVPVVTVALKMTASEVAEAVRKGVDHFIDYPPTEDAVIETIVEVTSKQPAVSPDPGASGEGPLAKFRFIGQSEAVMHVAERVGMIAPTRTTVLLQGETGTGKELIGEAIHLMSPRAKNPLVKLNCAELAESVMESELFGHERGAFTGAVARRRGRFETASGGTLFLDEVSEIPISTQIKLLRVLERQEFERVGGSIPIKVDVRLIAATNRDLRALVDQGFFREDLFHRLSVANIVVPSLRDRPEDIPLLVRHFITEFNRANRKAVRGVTREAMTLLVSYDWPGNARELRNLVEGLVVFSKGRTPIDIDHLPDYIRQSGPSGRELVLRVGMSLEEIERTALEETLRQVGYNKKKAAETLGVGLRTIYRKMKKYRLT